MRFNKFGNKYGNIKVKSADGLSFDSRLEYQHYLDLKMLEKIGKISDLKRQVTIPLGAWGAVKYRADFVYFDNELNRWKIWDSKGVATKEFKVKLAWLLESYKNFSFMLVSKRERKEYEPTPRCENAIDFSDFMELEIKKKERKNVKNARTKCE